MRDFLKTRFDGYGQLLSLAHEVSAMSNAFYDTGNEKVANTLDTWAVIIRENVEAIRKADAEDITDQTEKSREFLGLAVSAAVAVMIPKAEGK